MTDTPERIPGHVWRNSQLSAARFTAGCVLNGKHYLLNYATDELVRADVLKAEAKARREEQAAKRAHAKDQQTKLLP
jgi:hypothetical protein